MSAPGSPANPYLRTQILTASPHELRLMLYDGCLKFCRQGRVAIEKQDHEATYNSLMRAQKIVLELSTSLQRDVDQTLTDKMAALYTYAYRKLVDANMNRDLAALDEVIQLIAFERETWQMLMNKVAAKPTPSAPITGAQQTAISSLSQSA